MKKPVITVIGSYIVGMTMRVPRFPTAGETLVGHSYGKLHGGKGSNQAVECARLGAEVRFIACVGNDANGRDAVALHQSEGVFADHMIVSERFPTAAGFVIVNEAGENVITLDLGANLDLSPARIEAARDIIAGSDILLMQLEIPVETVMAAAAAAYELGVRVILNPAPYQPLPDELFPKLFLLTPNEKEARLMAGYGPEHAASYRELGERITGKGAQGAIITLGGDGAFVITGEGAQIIRPPKVNVVDSTGAGDTFSAALAVAVAEGRETVDAVRFATAAASLSVQKYGVIESMPFRGAVSEELDRQI